MKKHKHYQQIRAYADGWGIEYSRRGNVLDRGNWTRVEKPLFSPKDDYRIVPDEDGWIPWYYHEDAERPIEGPVEVMNTRGEVYWLEQFATVCNLVTHYRPAKTKREWIAELLEACCDKEQVLNKIMEIVEE